MAIVLKTAPSDPPTAASDWTELQTLITMSFLSQNGYIARVNGTNIAKGSVFQIGGAIFYADSDTAISGSETDYVKITPAGSTASAAFVSSLSGVTWNDTYNGYYDSSVNLYVFDELKAVQAAVITEMKSEFAPMRNDGSIGNATTGAAIGYQASTSLGGAVGREATATWGGAVGSGAEATTGGAVGWNSAATTGGAVGNGADATAGGAVGSLADATTGGAVGYGANATTGGAVGYVANATTGGAIGALAEATTGGAVGNNSAETMGGGAVGNGADATTGGAVGYNSDATSGAAVGYGSAETLGGGAAGYNSAATTGGAVGYEAAETSGGGAVGYSASATFGGAVGNDASATTGGAVGDSASTGSGGAVGYNSAATDGGGAVGWGASVTNGGAAGLEAVTTRGAAVGYQSDASYGCAAGNQTVATDGAAVGNSATANGTHRSAVGASATSTADYQIRIGTASDTIVDGNGNTITSDKRDKINISDNDLGLAFIQKIRTTKFQRNFRELYFQRRTQDEMEELKKIAQKEMAQEIKENSPDNSKLVELKAVHEKQKTALKDKYTDIVEQDERPGLTDVNKDELARSSAALKEQYKSEISILRETQKAERILLLNDLKTRKRAVLKAARKNYRAKIPKGTLVTDDKNRPKYDKKAHKSGEKAGSRWHRGVIAQEIEELFDTTDFSAVKHMTHNDENAFDEYALDYSQFIAPLIKAVQELSEKIVSLEGQLDQSRPLTG